MMMVEAVKKRWNSEVLSALLLALGALAASVGLFVSSPLQSALPWLSLVLGGLALIVLSRGLWLAFSQTQIYRGKALSIVLGLVTLLLAGSNIFLFFIARRLPNAAESPQVGRRAADFTLTDASGQAVSLDSLFSAPAGRAAPKAVLLIFYRGYW